MLTTSTISPVIPPKRVGTAHLSPRFQGNPGTEAGKKGVEIAHLGFAKWLQGKFQQPLFQGDIRFGGFSLEDISARFQTLFGVYLLQGYYSIKDDKHPWETNGRNAIVWLLTAAVTAFNKSESYGINPLILNGFMQQKGSRFWIPGSKKLLDPFRMDVDYLDIIEKSGIRVSPSERNGAISGKKALWASSWLDANRVKQIEMKHRALGEELVEALTGRSLRNVALEELKESLEKGHRDPSALKAFQNKLLNEVIPEIKSQLGQADVDKALLEKARLYEAIPQLFKRMNIFNVISTSLITAVTVYVIGGLAMKLVNRFIAPFDKDYDGPKKAQCPPSPARPALPAPVPSVLMMGATPWGGNPAAVNTAMQVMPSLPMLPMVSASPAFFPRPPVPYRAPYAQGGWS